MKHIYLFLLILLTACAAAPVAQPTSTGGPTRTPLASPTPTPIAGGEGGEQSVEPLQAMREHLARQLGINPDDVSLYEMREQMWPDGCLGLALPGEMCTQAIVPGYIVILETPQGKFEYHADQTLSVFRRAATVESSGVKPGLLVTWQRTGGIAGICWQMSIQSDGQFQLYDCKSREILTQGTLPDKERTYLQGLASQYAPHQWAFQPPSGSADMFIDSYAWSGKGSQMPDEEAQTQLNSYLASLATQFASQPAQPTAQGSSGIRGIVMLGPTCPGPTRIDDPQCADKPYQATVTVLDAQGHFITKFSSGEDGVFQLTLTPGEYTLHPESPAPFPSAPDQVVTVFPGQFTQVIIQYDTGMR